METEELILNIKHHCFRQSDNAERVLSSMLRYIDERTLQILLYKIDNKQYSADLLVRTFDQFLYNVQSTPFVVYTAVPPHLNPDVLDNGATLGLEVRQYYRNWRKLIEEKKLHPLSLDMCGNNIINLIETYSILRDTKYINMKNDAKRIVSSLLSDISV